jgi:hypothetical protein
MFMIDVKGVIKMTVEQVATEITKAWLEQLNGVRSPSAEEEIKRVYAAAVEACLEGLDTSRNWRSN